MSDVIDARGLSCPQPVILTMKAMDSGILNPKILVDNEVAVGNITRFVENKGHKVKVEEKGEDYLLKVE